MGIVRRVVAVCCFVVLTASDSVAFKVDYHVEITNDGLARVGRELPPNIRAALQKIGVTGTGFSARGFTDTAIREIVDANKATDQGETNDQGDCVHQFNPDVAARPCASLGSETLAAINFLAKEPASDHFDNETIPVANNQLFLAREEILDDLSKGRFVAARKVLGRSLHAIQDFYAHTNWVELGYPGIEKRLGTQRGFSDQNVLPRLAKITEETCSKGELLLTNYLTSGYFFTGSEELNYMPTGFGDLPLNYGDPAEITKFGKCRHGWVISDPLYGQKVYTQPGISKDEPIRPGFSKARQFAFEHTFDYVMGLLKEPRFEARTDLLLGFLGYEPAKVMDSFRLGIPGAPNGASWDTAIRSILTFNLKNIQPDISVCMESATVAGLCAPVCEDADWSNDLNAYVCARPLGLPGRGILADPDLRVQVREMDFGRPVRTIASFRVEDPTRCDPFCSLELEPGRTVWIQFEVKPAVPGYVPERRSDRPALSPPSSVPVAKPASASSPGSPPGGAPGAPSSAPSAPSAALPGGPSSFASRTAPAAPAPRAAPRSPEAIDAALRLRDADSCVGADSFYPAASGQNPQLYQMAAFSIAISDRAVKQNVLDAIRAKVGDDAFFSVMTGVIGDPRQSQALLGAYQNTASNVVQQIASSGLTSLMRTPVPASALLPNVDRWILSTLSSPALVSSAVDMMSGPSPVTAECALNELAKRGFTATVVGP